MYKLKIIALLLVCTLSFSACSFLPRKWGKGERKEPRVERMGGDTGVVARVKFQTILDAIENKDAEAIKALFSTKALAEAHDIDGAIDYLFNLFDGEVISWDVKANSTGRSHETTGEYELIRTIFNVYTKKSHYQFLTLDYNKNTEDLDMQGVYTIHSINIADENAKWGPWQELKVPGVYMPEGYVADG